MFHLTRHFFNLIFIKTIIFYLNSKKVHFNCAFEKMPYESAEIVNLILLKFCISVVITENVS